MSAEMITKAAGIVGQAAGSDQASAIVRTLLGPASEELGDLIRDKVRLYRYGWQLRKGLEKVKQLHARAGVETAAVPLSKLLPLLDGLALEENEQLHNMWVSLLARAAGPLGETVRPGFVDILKTMSPEEAALLNWFYEKRNKLLDSLRAYARDEKRMFLPFEPAIELSQLEEEYATGDDDVNEVPDSVWISLEALLANRLLEEKQMPGRARPDMPSQSAERIQVSAFQFTMRGIAFVEACQGG